MARGIVESPCELGAWASARTFYLDEPGVCTATHARWGGNASPSLNEQEPPASCLAGGSVFIERDCLRSAEHVDRRRAAAGGAPAVRDVAAHSRDAVLERDALLDRAGRVAAAAHRGLAGLAGHGDQGIGTRATYGRPDDDAAEVAGRAGCACCARVALRAGRAGTRRTRRTGWALRPFGTCGSVRT